MRETENVAMNEKKKKSKEQIILHEEKKKKMQKKFCTLWSISSLYQKNEEGKVFVKKKKKIEAKFSFNKNKWKNVIF